MKDFQVIANSYGVDCASNCSSVHADIRRVRCASGFYSRTRQILLTQGVSVVFIRHVSLNILGDAQ